MKDICTQRSKIRIDDVNRQGSQTWRMLQIFSTCADGLIESYESQRVPFLGIVTGFQAASSDRICRAIDGVFGITYASSPIDSASDCGFVLLSESFGAKLIVYTVETWDGVTASLQRWAKRNATT